MLLRQGHDQPAASIDEYIRSRDQARAGFPAINDRHFEVHQNDVWALG
jgi:hypothetical protein